MPWQNQGAYNNAMTIVALLFGGTSDEREISIRSADNVRSALESAGYKVVKIDTAPLDDEQFLAALQGCDVVFPVLHGVGGEDGEPQQWLDKHGYSYVGSDAASSAVCFDKSRFKQAVSQFGIVVAAGGVVNATEFWDAELITRPFVLKPHKGGSSVDTFIVRDPKKIDADSINAAFTKYEKMLLEELIEGIEITAGIINDMALPVVEIIPPENGEFDYENKYNGKTQELCPPQHVADSLQKQAQTLALKIHRQLRLRDMSRTDMIIRSDDNALYVLETNTIPGMSQQSLLPKAAAESGLDMPELMKLLVEAALTRRSANAK